MQDTGTEILPVGGQVVEGITDTVETEHSAVVPRDNRATIGAIRVEDPRIRCTDVNVYYGGARAINDVNLDYEVLGGTNGMLMVSISGTAVKLS